MGQRLSLKNSRTLTKIMGKIPLSKLKVFHQVLVIIGITISFLIIQGIFSIYVNLSINESSNLNIHDMDKRFNNVVVIKRYVELIEKEYLKSLTGRGRIEYLINEGDIQGLPRIGSELVPAVKALEDVAPDECKDILTSIDKIRKLIREPVGEDNYTRLKAELNAIYITTENVYKKSTDSSFESIKKSVDFANLSIVMTILIMVICALFSLLLALVMTYNISNPLQNIVLAVKSLAGGNLAQKVDAAGCPEVSEVVVGLNQAVMGLQGLVTHINQQSDALFHASNELKSATSETGQSMNQVATAMAELAGSSTAQSSQVTNAVQTIQRLSDLVTKVSQDTSDMAEASRKVSESARAGQKASTDVSQEINELYHSALDVAKVIRDLSETSGEISEITTLIQGIAEQTTLLALNAAIEAARAGEHGKGFAIVASETGKLADQSKQSAILIAQLIVNMNMRIEHAVAVMEKSTQRAEVGKDLSAKAAVTFEEIFDSLHANLNQIEAVARSARQMAERNRDAIEAVSAIASITEESMASTQEVTATVEEQSAAVQQVDGLAENLSRVAANLKESVSNFMI